MLKKIKLQNLLKVMIIPIIFIFGIILNLNINASVSENLKGIVKEDEKYFIDYDGTTPVGTISNSDLGPLYHVPIENLKIFGYRGEPTPITPATQVSELDETLIPFDSKLEEIKIYFNHEDGWHRLVLYDSSGGYISYILGEEQELYQWYDDTPFYIYFTIDGVDTFAPVLENQTFGTSVDDPKPLSFFIKDLKAIDETDGDVSSSIKVIEDNYTSNMHKVGKWDFTVEFQDLSGNKDTKKLYIYVGDTSAPTIIGSVLTAKIGYKETFNIESFKKTLVVSDNYDTNLSYSNIIVDYDNYTSNKNKIGTYQVKFKVTDSSGNHGYFTKPIQVIDNVAPTWTGTKTWNTSNNTVLTESDIRKVIKAVDEIDGDLTSKIKVSEDLYSGNGDKVGKYTIKYEVTDNSNNTSYFIVEINRDDRIPPKLYVKDGVSFVTTISNPLTRDQLIEILRNTGQININATTSITFLVDEYTSNSSEVGTYAVSLLAKDTKGNEQIANLMIEVEQDSEDEEVKPEPLPKLSLLEKIKEFYNKSTMNKVVVYATSTLVTTAVLALVIFIIKKIKK